MDEIETPKAKQTDAESFLPHRPQWYTSPLGIVTLISLTILTGIVYVLLEWFREKKVEDVYFVSMLIGATVILSYGISYLNKYILNKGLGFCVFLLSKSDSRQGYEEYNRLCRSVVNVSRMTVAGVIYGVVVGSAPFVLGVWKNDVVLRLSLSVFMFCVNFATGIAFYVLIMFFVQSTRMGRLATVNLWQVNNPSTAFLLGATRRFSVVASVYASISLSSILFSLLPIGGFVILYSCFAGLTIVASIFVPSLPIARKLREAKEQALLQIDKQLHLTFHKSLEDTEPGRTEIDFDKVKTLLELREKIEAIQTWPFRTKSIVATASVIFFSAIPVFLQLALQRVFE